MATFRVWARVLEPDDPSVKVHAAGFGCPGGPGVVLAEVLRRNGGVYATTVALSPGMRQDMREAAELTSDAELLALSWLTEVPVSLEHLRGIDPETRISIGAELLAPDVGGLLSRHQPGRRPKAIATVLPDGTVVAGGVDPADFPGTEDGPSGRA